MGVQTWISDCRASERSSPAPRRASAGRSPRRCWPRVRRSPSARARPRTSTPPSRELSAKGQAVGTARRRRRRRRRRGVGRRLGEQLGGIDIYVHNTSGKPARKLEGWINNFNIDLMSLVNGVDAAKEALADGGGSVISIGTTATAEHFASGSGSYSALKSAVTNWTLGQAQVLGAQGIRCNVVSPGPIFIEGGDWDMIKQNMADFYEATQKGHPGGDLGQRAGRRRRGRVPGQRPRQAHQRRQPDRRRRLPEARRLLRHGTDAHGSADRRHARRRRQVPRHRLRPPAAARPARRARGVPRARPARLRGRRGHRRRGSILVSYTCDVRPSRTPSGASASGSRAAVAGSHCTARTRRSTSARPNGVDAPRIFPLWADTLGSQFVAHPPIQPYRVEVSDPDHWLVAGIEPFETDDELYLSRVPGPRRAAAAAAHARTRARRPGSSSPTGPPATPPTSSCTCGRSATGRCCTTRSATAAGTTTWCRCVDYYPRIERCSWEQPAYYELLRRSLRWARRRRADGRRRR